MIGSIRLLRSYFIFVPKNSLCRYRVTCISCYDPIDLQHIGGVLLVDHWMQARYFRSFWSCIRIVLVRFGSSRLKSSVFCRYDFVYCSHKRVSLNLTCVESVLIVLSVGFV